MADFMARPFNMQPQRRPMGLFREPAAMNPMRSPGDSSGGSPAVQQGGFGGFGGIGQRPFSKGPIAPEHPPDRPPLDLEPSPLSPPAAPAGPFHSALPGRDLGPYSYAGPTMDILNPGQVNAITNPALQGPAIGAAGPFGGGRPFLDDIFGDGGVNRGGRLRPFLM